MVGEEEIEIISDQNTNQISSKTNSIQKFNKFELSGFLSQKGSSESTINKLLQEEIDGDAFLLLKRNDFSKELNLKFGEVVKLEKIIKESLK